MDDYRFYVTIFNVVVTNPFMAWIAWRRLAKAKAAAMTIAPGSPGLAAHRPAIFWAGVLGIVLLIEAVMIYDLFVKA